MRFNWTVSSDRQLYDELKILSKNMRIPVSRLFDEALEDLFIKHNLSELKKRKPSLKQGEPNERN